MPKRRGMPVVGVVSDMGHSLLKLAATHEDGWDYDVIPHALHQMHKKEWETATDRAGRTATAMDYLQVGQNYYIVGETAERYGHATRQMGVKRYMREYIGVQMVAMVARVCPAEEAELVVMAMHPPSDARYRDELRRALKGTWDVMMGDGTTRMYYVNKVMTTDEPVAGLYNIIIDNEGRENRDITDGETLVLDIGGGTTSVAPVLRGGNVDYARTDSYPMGILNVTHALERALKDHWHDMFKSARKVSEPRLRDALVTNQFRGGGRTVGCAPDVKSAKSALLEEIERMYFNGSVGGPLQFDTIVLTGGGACAMGDDLVNLLDHKNIHYAANEEEIHLANMYGGLKLFEMFINEGSVKL